MSVNKDWKSLLSKFQIYLYYLILTLSTVLSLVHIFKRSTCLQSLRPCRSVVAGTQNCKYSGNCSCKSDWICNMARCANKRPVPPQLLYKFLVAFSLLPFNPAWNTGCSIQHFKWKCCKVWHKRPPDIFLYTNIDQIRSVSYMEGYLTPQEVPVKVTDIVQ